MKPSHISVFIENTPKNVFSLLLDTKFPSLWLKFDFSNSWIHPLSTPSQEQFLIDSSLRWEKREGKRYEDKWMGNETKWNKERIDGLECINNSITWSEWNERRES